jgi:hypothetical protein
VGATESLADVIGEGGELSAGPVEEIAGFGALAFRVGGGRGAVATAFGGVVV